MTRRLHVVHYTYAVSEGGAANGIVNLCNGLDAARYKVSIITLTYLGGFDRRLGDHISVYRMRLLRGRELVQIPRLARFFRKLDPDIVHTHAWGTLVEGVVAARLARVPAVVHGEHGTMEERRSRRWVQTRLWDWADRVLSVSESLRRQIVQTLNYPEERIHVVPNGVDTGRFRPRPESRRRLREELGAADADVVLGAVGRLHPIKGHGHLIRALPHLPPRVKLWLVGDGEKLEAYRRLAAELGVEQRVLFLGHRDDAAEILSALDVMCQPSLNEGMSNTILEAMATHLPIVATDVGGNPELVTDGVNGRLVEVGSSESLARALGDLVERPDERARMGHESNRRVVRTYSMTRMVEGYADVYERAYEANRRHA